MQCDINLDAIINEPARQKIFDIILEEACRQWCDFIDEAPERASGEGFAQFFYEIFEMKEQDYMEDLGIQYENIQPESDAPEKDQFSIRRMLAQNKSEINAQTTHTADAPRKPPESVL